MTFDQSTGQLFVSQRDQAIIIAEFISSSSILYLSTFEIETSVRCGEEGQGQPGKLIVGAILHRLPVVKVQCSEVRCKQCNRLKYNTSLHALQWSLVIWGTFQWSALQRSCCIIEKVFATRTIIWAAPCTCTNTADFTAWTQWNCKRKYLQIALKIVNVKGERKGTGKIGKTSKNLVERGIKGRGEKKLQEKKARNGQRWKGKKWWKQGQKENREYILLTTLWILSSTTPDLGKRWTAKRVSVVKIVVWWLRIASSGWRTQDT